MSRPEDRDAMMRPQDPAAENKGRNTRDPVNWAVHGGNLQAFGVKGGSKKKVPTDTAPTDLPFALPSEASKLPPVIVTHDKDGLTTGQHSANDERFSNQEAVDAKESGEPSINDATIIVANKNEDNVNNQETDEAKAQASLDARHAKETPEEKKKREEEEELERLTNPDNQGAPVNQSANNSTNKTPKPEDAKKLDPTLTTR